jgi:hypothetical protein
MSFDQGDIVRLAREAAELHGVDFTVQSEEVRFKHRTLDWFGLLMARSQPSLQALAVEIYELAERTAGGPTS